MQKQNIYDLCELVNTGAQPEGAYGFIYMTTNLLNGKMYIGQRQFYGSWQTYLGSGRGIVMAVEKYGRENFHRDCVDIAYSREELDQKEIMWIDECDAARSELFYNIAIGGRTACNLMAGLSPQRKKSIYAKIVEIRKANGTYRNYKKGSESAHATPVVCVTTGEYFGSIIEAEQHYGINNISSCCRGERFYAGTLPDGTPLQWAYPGKENEARPLEDRYDPNRVLQYSLSGELLQVYASGRDAENKCGVHYSDIINVCAGHLRNIPGRKKTAGGYIWRYECDPITDSNASGWCEGASSRKIGASGVTGVCYVKQKKKWKARISVGGAVLHLGEFASFEDAVVARLAAEVLCFPKFDRQIELYDQYGFSEEMYVPRVARKCATIRC